MLAGGRSARFGRDKLAEPYRGRSILEHTVSALDPACEEIVVVLSATGEPPRLPTDAHVRFARDPQEARGPLAGVCAGLSDCRSEVAIVVGGDMPELSAEVLRLMTRRIEDPTVDAVALQDADRFRPLPCVVRVAPAQRAAAALLESGERRLRALLASLHASVVLEPVWRAIDPEGRTLFDVDEPGDLGD